MLFFRLSFSERRFKPPPLRQDPQSSFLIFCSFPPRPSLNRAPGQRVIWVPLALEIPVIIVIIINPACCHLPLPLPLPAATARTRILADRAQPLCCPAFKSREYGTPWGRISICRERRYRLGRFLLRGRRMRNHNLRHRRRRSQRMRFLQRARLAWNIGARPRKRRGGRRLES